MWKSDSMLRAAGVWAGRGWRLGCLTGGGQSARHTPETWKLYLDKGLLEAALIGRIRDVTELGHPLGDEAFVKRVREEQKAQPPAEPQGTVINHEMAAT
jgi:hypothetical protein